MSCETGRPRRTTAVGSKLNIHYFRAPKGREIFREGGRANAIFHVENGCVRLDVDRSDGERDVVGFLFQGDSFCAGVERYWVSAHAVTDCLLSCTPLPRVYSDVAEEDDEHFTHSPSDRLARDIVHRLSFIKHLPANARLAWFLGWLDRRRGIAASHVVELPMTCRDIANFLGMAPETVSRSLAELEQQGKLRRLGNRMIELGAAQNPEARSGS
ncbi:MAG: Crp/Fnr family transcriptional regulator [Ignavibacteriales bacterium]